MEQDTKSLVLKPSLRRVYFYAVLYLLIAIAGLVRLSEFGVGGNLFLASLCLLVLLLAYAHLARFFITYTVAKDYVESRSGIISRRGSRAALRRITDFSASQTILQRLLGLASVRVSTAGGDGAEIIFNNITRNNATRVISLLSKVTEKSEPIGKVASRV